jgi:predicted dehydrogenase
MKVKVRKPGVIFILGFLYIKIISNGEIGELVSIRHTEHVEHFHLSHSFVRGNWAVAPMILSKPCHDTDIMRWLIDKPCKNVHRMECFTGYEI